MNTKAFLLSILSVMSFSIIFSYFLIFGANSFFEKNISIAFKLSENVFLDSLYLAENKIVFESDIDLSKARITSNCTIESQLESVKGNFYLFRFKFLGNECLNSRFTLESGDGENLYPFSLNVRNEYNLLSDFLDYDTPKLEKLRGDLDNRMLLFLKYKDYNQNLDVDYYTFLKNNRLLNEIIYTRDLVNSILQGREQKYLIPVRQDTLPTKFSKLPNSGRPYRAQYTDGIHHGWDFDAPMGTPVIAVDDGIIVRSIGNFVFDDLKEIKEGSGITYDDKIKNLDILRGNQVWLKTMKGDIAFYAHLKEVAQGISVGTIVKKGQLVGKIGISGVPDKDYEDSHLHFEIQKNPYNITKVGRNSYYDYLHWDWEFRGKSEQYILDHQYEVFE